MSAGRIRIVSAWLLRVAVAVSQPFLFSSYAEATVRPIALQGDSPSGAGVDEAFLSFTIPSLNNRGQVAFGAQLTGAGVAASNDTGYWITSGGTFQPVIREGAAAPGMPAGSVFGNISSMFIGQVPLNDAGEIAVGQPVTLPDTTSSSGVWVGNHQSLSLLAMQGSPAPGAQDDAPFAGLSGLRASLNRRGDVAFNASLTGAFYTSINTGSYHDGFWVLNRNGAVATVVAGDPAEPFGSIAQFAGFQPYFYPSLNNQGIAAFQASHRLSGVNYQPAVWVTTPTGEVELRATAGQPLPEVGGNAVLSSLSQPGFNSAGTMAVNGYFSNSGGSPSSGNLIAVVDSSGTSLEAFPGKAAPGLPGYHFVATYYEATIGGGGHIAFYGGVSNGTENRSGVWSGRPGELEPIAVHGEVAPGANATFGLFARDTPAVNRFGQVAFESSLNDVQNGAASTALWATDLDGNVVMLARSGTAMEVAEGDTRTVSTIEMLTKHGDDDGRPRGMNDLGQIVFRANFTDGSSGIFLSNAVAHLPGDYSMDGTVDTGDYILWRKALPAQNLMADSDRNGIVDGADYDLMREFFGVSLELESTGAGGGAVPEPHFGACAVLGLVALRYRRASGSP